MAKIHLISFNLLGDPPGSREAGRDVQDALRGNVGPWRHQRGTRLHWADQRHLRPGAVRRHHNPGGLGGREERLRPQRRPLLRGGDEEWPPLSMLILRSFATQVEKGERVQEGFRGRQLMDWGNSPETEIKKTVSIPLLFFSWAG